MRAKMTFCQIRKALQIESSKGRGYKWNHLIEKIQIIVFKKGSIT